ncbi:MAG TPA: anhydro-N-acetylmuramic acid kinase, partial [Candidatus Limnocylindria bacterium]|nr:anhydro-N-acetylmuramic acid kinase [Candidatus Limnocylindria bacterium]
MIAVGLMSGTSADGVDAAAIQMDVPVGDAGVRVLFTASAPYPKEVREAVLALGEGGTADAREIARLHGLLGDVYARVAARVTAGLRAKPDVIAVHGQTVAHLPDEHVTLQIGDAARVATLTGVTTASDFRSADIAAGGQGAPLVPFADAVLFARLAPVAVLNLGGIANLTLMPSTRAEDVIAFDTGPANMVIDGVSAAVGATHDIDGHGAARGTADDAAVDELMRDPYFARRPPKSTGREQFGQTFAK